MSSHNNHKVIRNDYKVIKTIGRGNFGVVHLADCLKDGRKYVIKQIPLNELSKSEQDGSLQEVKLLSTLRHPFIVTYKESFLDSDLLHIVMVYCEGGDLASRIRERANTSKDKDGNNDNNNNDSTGKPQPNHFSEEQVLDWFVQIALALQFCHERKIIHRDLKSQNIFLTRKGMVRLGDFGIARVLNGTNELAMSVVGTPYSMSPEVCENKPYGFKSDIWALGCVLYEICMLKHAFDANNLLGLVWKIVQESFPPIPAMYSDNLRKLITMMLNKDPLQRPTIDEILELDFVSKRIRAQIVAQTNTLTVRAKQRRQKEKLMRSKTARLATDRDNNNGASQNGSGHTSSAVGLSGHTHSASADNINQYRPSSSSSSSSSSTYNSNSSSNSTANNFKNSSHHHHHSPSDGNFNQGTYQHQQHQQHQHHHHHHQHQHQHQHQPPQHHNNQNQQYNNHMHSHSHQLNRIQESGDGIINKMSPRERVLMMKQKRREQEIARRTAELKAASKANMVNRMYAKGRTRSEFMSSPQGDNGDELLASPGGTVSGKAGAAIGNNVNGSTGGGGGGGVGNTSARIGGFDLLPDSLDPEHTAGPGMHSDHGLGSVSPPTGMPTTRPQSVPTGFQSPGRSKRGHSAGELGVGNLNSNDQYADHNRVQGMRTAKTAHGARSDFSMGYNSNSNSGNNGTTNGYDINYDNTNQNNTRMTRSASEHVNRNDVNANNFNFNNNSNINLNFHNMASDDPANNNNVAAHRASYGYDGDVNSSFEASPTKSSFPPHSFSPPPSTAASSASSSSSVSAHSSRNSRSWEDRPIKATGFYNIEASDLNGVSPHKQNKNNYNSAIGVKGSTSFPTLDLHQATISSASSTLNTNGAGDDDDDDDYYEDDFEDDFLSDFEEQEEVLSVLQRAQDDISSGSSSASSSGTNPPRRNHNHNHNHNHDNLMKAKSGKSKSSTNVLATRDSKHPPLQPVSSHSHNARANRAASLPAQSISPSLSSTSSLSSSSSSSSPPSSSSSSSSSSSTPSSFSSSSSSSTTTTVNNKPPSMSTRAQVIREKCLRQVSQPQFDEIYSFFRDKLRNPPTGKAISQLEIRSKFKDYDTDLLFNIEQLTFLEAF